MSCSAVLGSGVNGLGAGAGAGSGSGASATGSTTMGEASSGVSCCSSDADPAARAAAAQRLERRQRLQGGGRLLLRRLRAAQERVAQGLEPGRHLVDRRRRDDEQPEDGQQHEHRDGQPGRQALLQRVAEQEADQAALLVARQVAAHDVDDPEGAERQGQPADDEPAAAALALRVAQHPPRAEHEQRRQEERSTAERGGEDLVDLLPRAAGVPPRTARGDQREREQQQAEAVAAVGGVEVAGAAAGRPAGAADGVRGHLQDADDGPDESADQHGDAVQQLPERARPLRLRAPLGAGGPLLRGRLPGRRARSRTRTAPGARAGLRGRATGHGGTLPPRTTRHSGPSA